MIKIICLFDCLASPGSVVLDLPKLPAALQAFPPAAHLQLLRLHEGKRSARATRTERLSRPVEGSFSTARIGLRSPFERSAVAWA